MAERDRQRYRDVEVDVDVDVPGSDGERPRDATAEEQSGTRSRIRDRASSLLSGRALVVSLVLAVAGVFLIGGAVGLGPVGDLLGIAAGTFLSGVVGTRRHYAESGLAGTVAGGGATLLGNLALALVGVGIPLVAVGALAGGLAGLVGHYFGRDLRDGLTRDL